LVAGRVKIDHGHRRIGGRSSHMTAIEQSPSLDPERKWKRIVIWMVAALDLAALTILLWTW
jgi:hypothetical protein